MDQQQLINQNDNEEDGSSEGSTASADGLANRTLEEEVPSGRKYPLVTVEPVIAIVFLAQCLSDSVLTELFLKRTCEVELKLNQTFCDTLGTPFGHDAENYVQPYAADLLMWKLILQSIVPAFWSFFLGPWTDIHGRKPVMVASVAGVSLMYSSYVVLAYIPHLHPSYILLGVIPLSFCGGYVNLISAAYCYVSDISTVQRRSFRLAFLECAVFIGVIAGLLSSAPLYKIGTTFHGFGFLTIFGISALLTFLTLVYLILVVPETIADTQPGRGFKDLFDLTLPVSIWKTCLKKRSGNRRAIILLCMLPLAAMILILEGESQVTFLYTRFLFQWTISDYTLFSSAVMVTTILGTIFGLWFLPKFLKLSDLWLASTALTTDIIQCIVIAVASTPRLLYTGVVIGSLRGIAGPCVRSIISKAVPIEDLGKVFAMASVVEAIVPFLASPLYVGVYTASIEKDHDKWPGAFFLLSAAIYFTAIICLVIIGVLQYRYKESVPQTSLNNDPTPPEDEQTSVST